MERARNSITGFNKRDIERRNDAIGGGVPAVISFGVRFIADKSTTKRTSLNFRGMSLKENISMTTNFTKMGKIRLTAEP